MLRSDIPGCFHDAAQPPLRIRAHQVHPRADAEASRMGGKTARGTRDLVGQDAARALRRARDGRGPRLADAVRVFFRVTPRASGVARADPGLDPGDARGNEDFRCRDTRASRSALSPDYSFSTEADCAEP